jgi:Co/Zn/Cd efflux system component
MEESEKILEEITACLAHEFQIQHSTVQFERAGLISGGLYMPEPLRGR